MMYQWYTRLAIFAMMSPFSGSAMRTRGYSKRTINHDWLKWVDNKFRQDGIEITCPCHPDVSFKKTGKEWKDAIVESKDGKKKTLSTPHNCSSSDTHINIDFSRRPLELFDDGCHGFIAGREGITIGDRKFAVKCPCACGKEETIIL